MTSTVRVLPPGEQLRLAALILQNLAQSEMTIIDWSDAWSEQDPHHLTTVSLPYATDRYPEDEALVVIRAMWR
jgi:hypothetical protein